MRTIFVLLACIVIAGCGDERVVKPPLPDIQMTVTVTPSSAGPGNPARIAAQVINSGVTPRSREGGCSFWGGVVRLSTFDRFFNRVYLWNPLTRPLCPDGWYRFSPGERLNAEAMFDGKLYSNSGKEEDAMDGTYTFVVSFSSWREGEPPGQDVIEQLVTVRWTSK
ncbi:MAG TPA: hypothetical protein VES59_03990 [Bacteroidota bacterium]|nr:hypothetical protein [Bacteroidota bacterium]